MKIFKRCFERKGFAFLFLSSLLAALVTIITISGCALFRKKNKCNDCPNWGHEKDKNEKEYSTKTKKSFRVDP
jgi:hypothetical protein